MSLPPPRFAGASSFPPPAFSLAAPIENPESVVDALLASLARGRLTPGVWEDLHEAARRDGCVEGVASAFASVSSGPRMKMLQPSVAAEFHFQAARFLEDVCGDDLGAAMHLERSLEIVPGHLEAFAKMEALLELRQKPDKLAELYARAAPHRPRGQQALMLRRAADCLARAAEASGDGAPTRDRAIAMWEEIVRLEPGDDEARSRLEALCIEAGRFRDAVRLNEQSLARDPPPDAYVRGLILERIVALYADSMGHPERAIAHVEQLLSMDPKHPGARRVAESLLSIKGLAARAAAALALASRKDAPHEAERYLSIELESARGSRRAELLVEIGKLREEILEEPVAALEAYEQALVLEPSNEEVRVRYVAIAASLECHADVVRVIERVLAAVKEPSITLRASVELGEALLGQRNAKRAKTVLAEVLASLSAPPDVQLRAARSLCVIYEANYERRAVCDTLDRIALLTADADEQREANRRLAAEALKVKDSARAIEAYQRLLSTPARHEALEALSKLCRSREDREKYARLLDEEKSPG
jgi:tetratricopeptide (TPR) repeat protein